MSSSFYFSPQWIDEGGEKGKEEKEKEDSITTVPGKAFFFFVIYVDA